jgi:competence protein ComEC
MSKKSVQILIRFGGLILLAVFVLFMNQRSTSPRVDDTLAPGDGEDILEVHFIDVGQGDAILIETEASAMLIDAGENNMGTTVVDYLQKHGVDELDYVIGTHPHSDHIGGLDYVISHMTVNQIIMPDIVHTTKTYEDVLDAIAAKGLAITKPEVGDEYRLGPASFRIIAPNSSGYDDINDYSIGIKLTYDNISFLLAGDAGTRSENEMLKSGIDLTANVLKISHHGSEYSSSATFLDAVNPEYAVISVGKDNEYGHPHAVTLQALKDRGIKLYRTDEQSNVVFTTDGKSISVNSEPYDIR